MDLNACVLHVEPLKDGTTKAACKSQQFIFFVSGEPKK